MNALSLSATPWRKSSRSTDTGGQCVEVAAVSPMTADGTVTAALTRR